MSSLFDPFNSETLKLKNKIVMAPMTRSRATAEHVPTGIMATYYGQRSGAGLIITEGTSPSPNGVGYARIPGLYTAAHAKAWKAVTEEVHKEEVKIFVQLMHTGRVSHPDNMPEGSEILAPSAKAPANTEMYTDANGNQPIPTPKAMTSEDIEHTINEFVTAAKLAVEAGFDGIELHSANGYLLEQFINPGSNERTDQYGGSNENRARFVLEVAKRTAEAIAEEKVGIRLSPGGAFNDVNPFDGQEEAFTYLASELGKLGLAYLHLVDHSSMGTPEVPGSLKEKIRDAFGGTIIISGGYDKERAEKDLADGLGHLVAFGRPFLANPDLPKRLKEDAALNEPDFGTFYSPGAKGYTDYPALA